MSLKGKLHQLFDGAYHIGIIEKVDFNDLSHQQIRWVDNNGYDGGWFADPFILDCDEKCIHVLAEELRYDTNIGCISLLTIDRNTLKLMSVHPVLRLSTHLSFPYIQRVDDRVYVVPENYQGGEAAVYSYADGTMTRIEPIITGKPLDTQIIKAEGRYYAFATMHDNAQGLDCTKTLYVYASDNLISDYALIHTIDNDKREERGAGTIFCIGDKIVRPAQVCEGGYGKGIVFYHLEINGRRVTETEIGRLLPDASKRYGLGLHTFSVHGDMAVVDGFDYPSRLIAALAPAAYKVKDKINKMLK